MDATSPAGRPRLDARMTAWLIEERARLRALELDRARLEGQLSTSERIERAAQRYADKLEEKLADARRREASLARALGYAEAQRDLLARRLGKGAGAKLPELESEWIEVETVELEPRAPGGSSARTARRP